MALRLLSLSVTGVAANNKMAMKMPALIGTIPAKVASALMPFTLRRRSGEVACRRGEMREYQKWPRQPRRRRAPAPAYRL